MTICYCRCEIPDKKSERHLEIKEGRHLLNLAVAGKVCSESLEILVQLSLGDEVALSIANMEKENESLSVWIQIYDWSMAGVLWFPIHAIRLGRAAGLLFAAVHGNKSRARSMCL